MAILNLPQFEDKYDSLKMRSLVQQLESISDPLSSKADERITGNWTFDKQIKLLDDTTTLNHGIGISGVSSSMGFKMSRISLADDAIGTIAVPSLAIIFVVTSLNQTANIAFMQAAQEAPILLTAALGALADQLPSTNPDTDTKANYWKSTTTELSIKNRLGSTRAFNVFVFGGI